MTDLNADFEEDQFNQVPPDSVWLPIPQGAKPLKHIFAVDGSFTQVNGTKNTLARRVFIKTALLGLDLPALGRIDQKSPHPLELRDLLSDTALHHSTVLPLRFVTWKGKSIYQAIREIVYTSFKDDTLLHSYPYQALKWLIYQKWDQSAYRNTLPEFECPSCGKLTTLVFDADEGDCDKCGRKLCVTDMLGFHQEMTEDSAPDGIASSYMAIHETMMLFSGIWSYWESFLAGKNEIIRDCLFIKDGPLSIRAQYSKLVQPIRSFLSFAKSRGVDVHLLGQEKSGAFFDHLFTMRRLVPEGHYFIPSDSYIKNRVQSRADDGAAYGQDTNYGAKVFFKHSEYHSMVLNLPTGIKPGQLPQPTAADIIGFDRIAATLPGLLSQRFEGALLPVELANDLASLATYPSVQVFQMFSEKT